MKRLNNSKGTIWYGLHMYPGVAEYANDGKPFRVLLNEKTIKGLDKSFAGRPVYLQHADEVEQDLDKLRNEADGWVMRSFFNPPDGKHWCQFITVTKQAEKAITEKGFRLSNCITDMQMTVGGECNGVSYDNEVVGGEYEHLAIVSNPRYEQSVILTPEQFQKYNDEKLAEIKRLSNHKEPKKMKLTFFKKEKMENSKTSGVDFELMSVLLPKSNVEKTVLQLVNEADAVEEAKKSPAKIDMTAMVSVGGVEMSVTDLVSKYNSLCAKIDALEEDTEIEEDDEDLENEADDDDLENSADDEEDLENEADDEDEEETPPPKKKVKNAAPPVTPIKKKKVANSKTPEEIKSAKIKADKLRNANPSNLKNQEVAKVILSVDQVQRGKELYGR